VYGWFERIDRGVYAAAPAGLDAVVQYADVLAAQRRRDHGAQAPPVTSAAA